MNYTLVGMGVGAFLAFMAFAFGFWAFLIALIFIAIGAILGRAMDGKLDLRGVIDALTGRRSSS
ncbi:DUF2273 domain-containing protein [Psychromicrobium lacuslunae]|uniref:Membrane protein n=1 Tax=Psychromicrobium lacuslunae TaxID=1618207 RepID=A0A0D4C1F0_9MICC|nr:DUF2273 domain-containing protein [Psychromicrobium lacuslunae]AJT42492.1 membrane protein [Psychromicrobium lacuslunae]